MEEVAYGYTLPPDTATLHGWHDTELALIQRIGKGIEYCAANPGAGNALDLLCVLMLTFEERFHPLPPAVVDKTTRLFCVKEAA